ncbi:MAG: prephenate dehydrogenase/arogenate dehydrogenase family protein, partial [Syntrophomonadaceae bacterium]|nr:prephenate dehydrogenase/arogenate dehydrogenase family protein [Syntrophomonadaceae bacterium]
VKGPVGRWLSVLPPRIHAVGGHPMAGSERTGIGSADRYLFENAVYVLTPFNQAPAEAVDRLAQLIGETGARVMVMDALTHDRAVAFISHLPHVLAYSLLSLVEESPEGKLLAAGSFRDLTRVAAASSRLWEDILLSNRQEVVGAINAMIERLKGFRHDLRKGNRSGLGRRISSAQQVRASIPQLKKGLLPEAHEIIVMVPDRPGMIGLLGKWLGDRGINIVDLEILRVREGDGGTIRLGVPTAEAAQEAVETLNGQGIRAWRR